MFKFGLINGIKNDEFVAKKDFYNGLSFRNLNTVIVSNINLLIIKVLNHLFLFRKSTYLR